MAEDEDEKRVEPVLLPPETAAEAPPEPAPLAPPPEPEEPASKTVEWALAVAMMSVLAIVFWMFLSIMR